MNGFVPHPSLTESFIYTKKLLMIDYKKENILFLYCPKNGKLTRSCEAKQ